MSLGGMRDDGRRDERTSAGLIVGASNPVESIENGDRIPVTERLPVLSVGNWTVSSQIFERRIQSIHSCLVTVSRAAGYSFVEEFIPWESSIWHPIVL